MALPPARAAGGAGVAPGPGAATAGRRPGLRRLVRPGRRVRHGLGGLPGNPRNGRAGKAAKPGSPQADRPR